MNGRGYRLFWTVEQENGLIVAGHIDAPHIAPSDLTPVGFAQLEAAVRKFYPGEVLFAHIHAWEHRPNTASFNIRFTHAERVPV